MGNRGAPICGGGGPGGCGGMGGVGMGCVGMGCVGMGCVGRWEERARGAGPPCDRVKACDCDDGSSHWAEEAEREGGSS